MGRLALVLENGSWTAMLPFILGKFPFRIPAPPIEWLLPDRDTALENVLAKTDDRLLVDAGTTRSDAIGLNRSMWEELRRSRRL